MAFNVVDNRLMSPKIFPALPQVCSRNILSFLDPVDLANFSQVSRVCREDASEERLWENHLVDEIKRPEGVSIQKYLGHHGVGSENQLIRRVQEFVNKVQINQRGVYECLFPLNPQYACRLEIGYGIWDRNIKPDIKQTDCFALKMDEPLDNIPRIERNSLAVDRIARTSFKKFSIHLPQNTSQVLETILDITHDLIELPLFFWDGSPLNDREFDIDEGLLFKSILKPCVRWRGSPNKSLLGKVGAKVACMILFATAGVLSIAEAVVSLALSVLAFTASLFLKERQWGDMLLNRSVTALVYVPFYIAMAFVQVFIRDDFFRRV